MPSNNKSFDFDKSLSSTKWLVDDIVPLGQLIFCLAHAGQGKSYFIESLATNMIFARDFLDKVTIPGDVLLIDQDTPQDILDERLISFGKAHETKPKFELFLRSHEGLNISNKSLMETIKEYPTATLIVIDSWHSVIGSLNPNMTNDMNFACTSLKKLLSPDRTIWVNHHISEKRLMTIQDMMFGEDLGNLFMGNSALVQQLDSAFMVSGASNNGLLQELYIRPWGKRSYISQAPFMARFVDSTFVYEGDLEDMRSQDECVCDIRLLFAERPDCGFKIKEAYDEMGRKHGINKVYKALAHMETIGEARMERSATNQFKYFPTENTRKPRVILGGVFLEEKRQN